MANKPLVSQDTAEILAEIIERVRSTDPANARNWLDDLLVLQLNGGLLEIACPDEAKALFLRDNCLASFTQAAQSVTGHLVSISFTVTNGRLVKAAEDKGRGFPKLHPDYTFDNFVVGPCNRLAHASCVAVSQSPGSTYNPLFLHGSVGLGKTHLLHAICHEACLRFSGTLVQFLSCEEFVNSFISAIEQGKLPEFQNHFRNIDILVIDDVQFLREREQSQEEFFHTFNALYNNHRQIVLTADCAPGELPSLEERLISRFKWGLVARIDAPSYETRIAIFKKKAHLRGLEISEDVAGFVAGKVTANIRELEGALTVIYAVARASGLPVTLELAESALGEAQTSGRKNVTITDIIEAVTKYFDVRPADLQSKKRSQSIALPRQICMYLARNLTKHSLDEIGGHLGGRDHSTVLHACAKIEELQSSDTSIRSQIAELAAAVSR